MLALGFGRRSTVPAIVGLGIAVLGPALAFAQLSVQTIPTQEYFFGIERLYRGDYRYAERTFRREVNTAIKIGVTGRWIDSICYHAMWGETLYHQGRLALALEQFNRACALFLDNPKWMLRVDFKQGPRPDASRVRRQIPWGSSGRQFTLGRFMTQMLIAQGDLFSGNRAAQQGGVVSPAQYWRVNVIEVVRCTALAIRRRNELLGPLGAHDTMARELVTAFSSGGAPPNHWSGAWLDLQYALAQVGRGKNDLAQKRLARALRIAGKFDHPLTCVVLLEQGRLEMEKGNTAAAAKLLAEASYSAFYYEDVGTIDEAFRLSAINRLAGGVKSVNPLLNPAAAWARRERYDHIFARLSFAMAEELMALGNWTDAATTLRAGQARLQDARTGLLGNWSQYLSARVLYHQGNETAHATLAQAVERQIAMAPRNLQIGLANQQFDQQQLRTRSAVDVYRSLLADPTPGDWVFRPLETLAVMKTAHTAAFDRWLAALLSRKATATAMEVTDLAKRRRFHSSLALGGKLAALRDTLEAPEHTLTQDARSQRSELLLKYPEYEQTLKAGRQLRAAIQAQWLDGIDEQAQRDLVKLWRDWSANLGQREAMLRRIGLERVSVTAQFPPLLATTDLQSAIKPGQAVVVFHNTSDGLLGFLVTSNAATHWNCGPVGRLNKQVNDFLRALGNYDANHDMTAEEMASDDWLEVGEKLFHALFDGSSIDPESMTELVVVPDSVVWYVPLAALPVKLEDRTAPLISISRLRVVPTMGLAFGHASPWRRIQRSGIAGEGIFFGETKESPDEMIGALRAVVSNPIRFPSQSPVATPVVASLLETLIALDEVDITLDDPLAWSPIPQSRSSKAGSLSGWLTLPQFGPQRVIIPSAHTLAERGGKISKRRPVRAEPGSELFLASCGLMSTGAQTILLSRWRVGGRSTLEIIREFVQELPHTTAADAWQRSVQVAMELPIDPDLELRVKASKDGPPMTAGHPFFWGGYLLIDAGSPAVDSEENPPAARAKP